MIMFRTGDVAKIIQGRGSKGMVEVISVKGNEIEFRDETGRIGTLFAAHLYKDAECVREAARRRHERADKIGRVRS